MCVRVRKFVLHPVRMCVCDTSCERVWNVNNNNKHLHNHSTFLLSCQILSPKKNRNRRYAAIVYRRRRRRLEQRKS